ncbi:apolipoprotein B receptor [Pteropus medius]|uniref:apolipoprotein B receptor n=1 Tax=Pteropus vampyrus TaxID=132908 RepID=UPI00196B2C8B|nr:apolipoprotein B receptor [Pteropus giganteus]
MDFLRLHLPELHQALRGALDSFSTFVSYLIGDEVPIAERREARAAEELGEVAAGKPGETAEEGAQEALEGLGGSQSKRDGGLRGPGEGRRCQEGSSATEQTWGWRESSSHGSQADRQDTGAWEAAKASQCQEPSAPLEARKKSEAGSEAGKDRNSQAQESQEHNVQEVNREETLRTWEQEEEEEEVRAREPGVVGGVESEWTWQKEPERKASADGQKIESDVRELEEAVEEVVAEEIQRAGVKEAEREEIVVTLRNDQSTGAQWTQELGAESEDGAALGREKASATLGREEAWTPSGGEEAEKTSDWKEASTASDGEEAGTPSGGEEAGKTSGREEADLPGVRETEYGAVPGDRIPEGTRRVWALEMTSKGDQEKEVNGNREAEINLFLKQTQALGIEDVEEVAKNQTAGREAAESQGSDEEVGEGFEGQTDQDEKEAMGRQDSEIKAVQASLEELVQTQEAKEEKESCWVVEVGLPQDKAANEAEGDADSEATPETRPEKEFREEKSEEEAQMGGEALGVECGALWHKVSEGQEPELMRGPQIPTEQPEEGQGHKEGLWSIPALSKEETERSLKEYPSNIEYVKPDTCEAEAWENGSGRDRERVNTQEEKAGTEAGEEEVTGGQESALPEVSEAFREWKKAKEAGFAAKNQELGGRHRAASGTDQSPGESDARKTKDEEVEAKVLWETDKTSRRGWRLEGAALSLQDSEDTWTSPLAAEVVEDKAASDGRAAGTREGPEREAGETWDEALGRGCNSEGREEAGRGEEPVDAAEGENRDGKEFGLEGSVEEEVTGRGGQAEDFEAREGELWGEWAEVRESVVTQGSCGIDGFTSGSQVTRAEGLMAIVEAEGLLEGQILLEKEPGVWPTREQEQGSEGQRGDHDPEGEAQMPRDVEDVEVTGHKRAEAKEIDPEGLEDIQGQENQSTNQDPTEAEPGPREEAAESAGGDVLGSWSEALLPGSRLDVSVPRSRIVLSRSSSQRRSRPSFRRTPTSEQQEEPPSPPPEEVLSAPEQRLSQPEEPPEPSPPRPEGTPVPARRRPLGHGFGLAHHGMMQELQARLGRPKPQ